MSSLRFLKCRSILWTSKRLRPKLQATFQVSDQVMMLQGNTKGVASVNPNMGTEATKVGDFTRMNPPEFFSSKVDEDPKTLSRKSARF